MSETDKLFCSCDGPRHLYEPSWCGARGLPRRPPVESPQSPPRSGAPRRFSYKEWSGRERNVTADRITFEPSGHVAFWLGSRLVVAEKRENCGNIFEHVADQSTGGGE